MEYLLINKLTTKPGKRDEVIEILLESGKAFNDNAACTMYLVSEDTKDGNVIWVQDAWTNEEDHRLAMSDPAMQEYVKKSVPLLEGMPEQHRLSFRGGKQEESWSLS